MGNASIAATYGATFAAARCEADKSRGRKFFDFWRFWDATKKAALDKAAYQAAYEAAFDRLYPTAERLHWRVMELVRQLNLTRFLWGPLP